MRLKAASYLLTFVVLALPAVTPRAALATPRTETSEIEEETAGEVPHASDPLDKEIIETIDISPPPKINRQLDRIDHSEYFYRYRKSMSPRIGITYDTDVYLEKSFIYLAGFQYLFPTKDLTSYEGGADLMSDGTGYAHFAQRWFLTRTRFRPYAKAGGAIHIVPRQALTTFLKFENYQIRGAVGAERLIAPPLSLRFEFEAGVGFGGLLAQVTGGYSWAW